MDTYKLKIRNITIIETDGQDTICFEIVGPTTHPEMSYTPTGKIMARKGYGMKWLSEMFDIGLEGIKVIRIPGTL